MNRKYHAVEPMKCQTTGLGNMQTFYARRIVVLGGSHLNPVISHVGKRPIYIKRKLLRDKVSSSFDYDRYRLK